MAITLNSSEVDHIIRANSALDRSTLVIECVNELERFQSGFADWKDMELKDFVWQFFDTGLFEFNNSDFDTFPRVASLVVLMYRENAADITDDLDALASNTATFHGSVPELNSISDMCRIITRELLAAVKKRTSI